MTEYNLRYDARTHPPDAIAAAITTALSGRWIKNVATSTNAQTGVTVTLTLDDHTTLTFGGDQTQLSQASSRGLTYPLTPSASPTTQYAPSAAAAINAGTVTP